MSKFDPTKPVQTRGGLRAQIIYSKINGSRPICAIVTSNDGVETYETYFGNGRCYERTGADLDLINIPEKRRYTRWVNIDDKGVGIVYRSEEEADLNPHNRIACIKIDQEYTVGEGLRDD